MKSYTNKICFTCKQDKLASEYTKSRKGNSGLVSSCKTCVSKKTTTWQKANPERVHAQRFKDRYGVIVGDQYNELLKQQDSRCAICDIHAKDCSKRLHLDHNHQTLKIRGLLCGTCNLMIGQARDNIQLLERSVMYLKHHSIVNT